MTPGRPADGESAPLATPAAALDFDSLFRLDGKTALIVGGYGGIGQHLTELFVSAGAAVAVAGRSREQAEAAARRQDGEAIGLEIDVVDRESVTVGVEAVVERFGSLDVVVNCASTLVEEEAKEFAEEDWRRVVDINLTGAFWLSQAVVRPMLESGRGGRIIHFSSTRSVAGGRRGFAAYSASKGGLNSLVRQLATEWAQYGVTVNAVAPGFVTTEFVEAAAGDESFRRMLLNRIPMARFGEPLEIAAAALFLATPAASFITGQIVFVDGGVTASS
jgi:NAD(P)-dependent dehydrogenase (short-subunit alcohol dehydrogenase family)